MNETISVPAYAPHILVWMALLNPAVIIVAVLMGRVADQWQKIFVAGFAAALAGAVLVWIGTFLQLLPSRGAGSDAGLLLLSLVFGSAYAALAFRFWHVPQKPKADEKVPEADA